MVTVSTFTELFFRELMQRIPCWSNLDRSASPEA